MTPATPQKIEDSFTSMRSDLLRIITRWEQSGQGEGGMDQEEQDDANYYEQENDDNSIAAASSLDTNTASTSSRTHVGCLSGRPARALQSRAAFLNGRPPYLLYFWEVADQHQLLQSSLQRLSNDVGAADGASSTASTRGSSAAGNSSQQRRREQQQQQSDLLQTEASMYVPLAKSLQDLANSHVQLAMQREEDRNHQERMEDRRQQSEVSADCRKRTFQRRAELLDQARQYRRLNAELDEDDANSQRLSTFYLQECQMLQDEIDALDNNM